MKLSITTGARFVAGAFFALAVVHSTAFAGPSEPNLGFTLQVNDGLAEEFDPNGEEEGGGWWGWHGWYGGDAYSLYYDITAQLDPQVNLGINITNTTNAVNVYTLNVTLPTGPFPGPNFIGGSVGGNVTDNNGDGATLVAGFGPGTWLYQGLIDGTAVPGTPPVGSQLYPNPTTFTAIPSGSADIPTINFGLPGPNQLTLQSVTNSIGIQLQFSLTPGDTAVISSSFILEPVPAPGGLALLGLLGLSMRRRRR